MTDFESHLVLGSLLVALEVLEALEVSLYRPGLSVSREFALSWFLCRFLVRSEARLPSVYRGLRLLLYVLLLMEVELVLIMESVLVEQNTTPWKAGEG